MVKKTAGRFLEYLIHGFYDGILKIRDKKNLSEQEMETLYAIGYNHFTIGNYESSAAIFVTLTSCAPEMSHYWRALGAVNQQMGNFEKAITGYDKAIESNSGDIVSYIYRAECYILSGQKKKGLEDLEKVLHDPKLNTPSPWVDRANIILSAHKKMEGRT